VRTTINQPILTGQIEAKGTNRTASGAETTTKNNQNTCSLKTLRLASEAFGALQGNGTDAVQRTILDTPSPSSSRAYERGGGSHGSPMANTRTTTIGWKPDSASEQAPVPRAIPSYVQPPEPLTCSGIKEEDTETQGEIDGENHPHGDAWNKTGAQSTATVDHTKAPYDHAPARPPAEPPPSELPAAALSHLP